jgi:hypothetical protein
MRNQIQLLALTAILFEVTSSLTAQSSEPSVTYADLNPSHATSSEGNGVAMGQSAGWADVATAIIYGYEFPTVHAALWSETAASFVDLHPGGYTNLEFLGSSPPVPYPLETLHPGWPTWSCLSSTSGDQQAGVVAYGSPAGYFEDFPLHAALWSGTPDSFVDLHPAGYMNSWAYATSGRQQVGIVCRSYLFAGSYAALWSGSAASFQNLNPRGAEVSGATSISGNQQAGWVYFSGKVGGNPRAAIWFGTADSFVDLHPAGASASTVFSTSGTQQGGKVTYRLTDHAAIWSGTAASFVDLNPPGASASSVGATTGSEQVGYVDVAGGHHAGIWFGTADSFVDLHAILPSSYYSGSEAHAIWKDRYTIKVLGVADVIDAGVTHAMQWTIRLPDKVPPVITRAWASQNILWPPNRRMVEIRLNALVEDDSGKTTWRIVGACSNEPEYDAQDVEILSAAQIRLRAARCGNAEERIYTVLLQAEDAAGNLSGTEAVDVVVPHDARRGTR